MKAFKKGFIFGTVLVYNAVMKLYIDTTTRETQTEDGIKLAVRALSEFIGMGEESIIIERNSLGKPVLASGAAHFNISHSFERVVCAVSEKPVGVDIEKIRPFRRGVVTRFFSESEAGYIERAESENEACKRFYELWTLKEAYVKMTGEGLKDLKKVSIAVKNGSVSSDTGCSFTLSYEEDGYVIAVCSR